MNERKFSLLLTLLVFISAFCLSSCLQNRRRMGINLYINSEDTLRVTFPESFRVSVWNMQGVEQPDSQKGHKNIFVTVGDTYICGSSEMRNYNDLWCAIERISHKGEVKAMTVFGGDELGDDCFNWPSASHVECDSIFEDILIWYQGEYVIMSVDTDMATLSPGTE